MPVAACQKARVCLALPASVRSLRIASSMTETSWIRWPDIEFRDHRAVGRGDRRHDGVSDVVGRQHPVTIGAGFAEARVDRSGADRHDPEAGLAHFEHQALRESEYRVLRRAVRGTTLDTVLSGERGDIDDRPHS